MPNEPKRVHAVWSSPQPSISTLDGRAVLGWATVRAGFSLVIVGSFLLLCGGFFGLSIRKDGQEASPLSIACVLLLLGSGLVLFVAGGSMSYAVPKGNALRERAILFIIGLCMLACIAIAMTMLVVERGRLEPSRLHTDPASLRLQERLTYVEKTVLFLHNLSVTVTLLTELSYFSLLGGVTRYFRDRPLARKLFWCLPALFVLLLSVQTLAWWLPNPGFLDPSNWAEEYVRYGMWVSGGLAIWLLLMVGRAHQTITETLVRR